LEAAVSDSVVQITKNILSPATYTTFTWLVLRCLVTIYG